VKGFPELTRPKTAPYSTTKISATESQIMIDKLLELYGITDIQWTKEGDRRILRFLANLDMGEGAKQRIGFKFEPPLFEMERKTYVPEKGRYEKLSLPNHAQGMRLLYDYLNMKLAATAWGMVPFEEEFLPNAILNTPKGETTFAEMVKKQRFLALPAARGQVLEIEAQGDDHTQAASE
jgi:hypothetical protein